MKSEKLPALLNLYLLDNLNVEIDTAKANQRDSKLDSTFKISTIRSLFFKGSLGEDSCT
jgi:hypothetical protein